MNKAPVSKTTISKASISLKYITRVERGQERRYRLRIRPLGLCESFSDSHYGGKEEALSRAIKARDLALAEAGLPLTDRVIVTRSPRNTSGVIGVRRVASKRYFEVPAIGRGKATYVPFGGNEQAAFKKAARVRREMERQAYGGTLKPNWAKALPVLNGDCE